MDIAIEKQRIKQELDKVNDESIILTIKKLLGLATNLSSTSISKEEMIARALESEKAIAAGKFITIEQLESEMKNW